MADGEALHELARPLPQLQTDGRQGEVVEDAEGQEPGGPRVAVGGVGPDAEYERLGVLPASAAIAAGGAEGDHGDGAQAGADRVCVGAVRRGGCGNCDNCLSPPAVKDATEAARKLLSAAYRTGQRFGVGHLIEVLTGKAGEKVRKFGHDQLAVFGIGSDLTPDGWKSLARQLEASEALVRDGEHGGLALGPAARAILKGEVAIELRADSDAPSRKTRDKGGANDQIAEADRALFDVLRSVRRELAAEAGLPPYVVFHDSTLRAMAAARPSNLDTLGRLPGVGQRKLEAYGAAFLAALAPFAGAKGAR